MADLEPFQAYQPIVEDLPYGVMVWHALSDNSSDLRLVYANREASVGLDRDLAVDIGKTIAEAFPQALRKPETGRRFVDVWLEAALKQEPAVIEEFTFGAHLFPRPRYNAAVVPLGERIVACVFKDITQERLIAATLEQREQLYRRMVETLPHPVWLAEANGEVIFLNEAWRVLTGQAQAESLGAGWLQAIHPEDKERVSELFAGEISTAMVQKGRMRVLGKGAERHLEYIFRPVRDAVGQISHWIGVATDITEIQRSQTALQNTAAFLDSIIENIPDMIFIKEAEELRFVRFNKAGEDLLGIPRTEMIGKNDYDFFPPDQAKAFNEDDWKVLRNRVPVTQPEEPIDTRDKGRRWLSTKKVPILDEDGHPSYLLGISSDVTARREMEESVRRSESLYRMVFKSAPYALWIEDYSKVKEFVDGLRELNVDDFAGHFKKNLDQIAHAGKLIRLIDINDAALRLFGVRAIEELPGGIADVFTKASSAKFIEVLCAVADGRTRVEGRSTIKKKDGSRQEIFYRWTVPDEFKRSLEQVLVSFFRVDELSEA